jgi:hypothetical protein
MRRAWLKPGADPSDSCVTSKTCLLASFVDITWTMVKQAASALRDEELVSVVAQCDTETSTQLKWLQSRMKQAAPQALVVAR